MNDTAMVRRDLLRLSRFLEYIGVLVSRNVLDGFELTEEEQNELFAVAVQPKDYMDNGFAVVQRSKFGAVLARSPEGEFFKTCRTCGELLPLSSFSRNSQNFAGYSADCKPCFDKAREEKRAVTKTILCPRCKERKPASEFSVSRTRRSGYQTYCKSCSAEMCRNTRLRLKNEH